MDKNITNLLLTMTVENNKYATQKNKFAHIIII